jgi:hypothetical protein
MPFADYTKRLLALAKTLHRWIDSLAGLDAGRRGKVADYADEIADTLARAVTAIERLEKDTHNVPARRWMLREFGRIHGYIETIVETLEDHLDGRKLAGVKRRLEQLEMSGTGETQDLTTATMRLDRLVSSEGYFRGLADALRV